MQLINLYSIVTKQTSLFLNSVPTLKQNEIPFMQNCDFQPLTPIPFPFLLTSWFFLLDVENSVAFWLFVVSSLTDLLSSVDTPNNSLVDAPGEFEFGSEKCDDEYAHSFLLRSGPSSLFFCQLLPSNIVNIGYSQRKTIN